MAKKLNKESSDILNARRKALKNQIAKEFGLIFMGDTHIFMCGNTNRDYYRKILNNIDRNNLVAIFHGGDGVHVDTEQNMKIFKQTTEEILINPSSKAKIPLFMNVGNHEYQPNTAAITFYDSLIGTSQKIQVYQVTPDSKNINVILEVILLNTGGPRADGFGPADAHIFQSQIAAINKRIADDIAKYSKEKKFVRFIIDMHIPPKIGTLGSPPKPGGQPHYLREPFNTEFKNLLTKQKGNIIAVVTHHRHCKATKVTYKSIPIFITTHAGQCTDNNTRLEYIRLRFRPTAKSYQIVNSKGHSYIVNVQK